MHDACSHQQTSSVVASLLPFKPISHPAIQFMRVGEMSDGQCVRRSKGASKGASLDRGCPRWGRGIQGICWFRALKCKICKCYIRDAVVAQYNLVWCLFGGEMKEIDGRNLGDKIRQIFKGIKSVSNNICDLFNHHTRSVSHGSHQPNLNLSAK